MEPLNIALLQLDLIWEDPQANRDQIEQQLAGLQEARHSTTLTGGSPTPDTTTDMPDLVLLPEMFTTGFTMEPAPLAEPVKGPTYHWMGEVARKYQTHLAGSLIVEEDGHYFNRLLVMGPEGLVGQYDKRHLFRMAGEHKSYAGGAEKFIFQVKGWKICPLVCYDLRFSVWSRNRVGDSGDLDYDVLLYLANWPAKRASHWNVLLRARAIENQAFVIGVNRVGQDGNGVPYQGDSQIVNYLGESMAHATTAGVLQGKLEMEDLVHYRKRFPAWKDADDFQITE